MVRRLSAQEGQPWLYHAHLGWLYTLGLSEDTLWFWDGSLGWLWTNVATFPYFYRNAPMDWLFYSMGSREPRWFLSTDSGTWFED